MPSRPASAEMRVQRALAQAGVASRRQGEELIKAGKVRIDGKVAELGSKVNPSKQKITVNGRVVKAVAKRWLAFNKPLGIVTTADDEQGRQTVFDLIPDHAGLTYVGRLDVMTTGLLLLTTDGEAVHRLTHPKYHIQRKYTRAGAWSLHRRDRQRDQGERGARWAAGDPA
jgi:23S rRNA pseudouridine2605 synthase